VRDALSAGREGENRASRLLVSKGYTILARNWRGRRGELDIVALEGGEIVFVEVKARRTEDKGSALDAVTAAKRRKVAQVAQEFLVRRGLEGRPCRFDVVAVSIPAGSGPDEIVRGAFSLEG